jgi:hypothetical protein
MIMPMKGSENYRLVTEYILFKKFVQLDAKLT